METVVYQYLGYAGLLTILMWTPYILARAFVWGFPTFLFSNYPKGFPAEQPTPPMWAQRAHRAHLNMVETMPAYLGVVLAAIFLHGDNVEVMATVATWSQIFFWSRIVHWVVYIAAVPALRTPTYLVGWAAILVIGYTALA